MTEKAPKLLVDALDAINAAQEFLAETSLDQYLADKMRRSAVERQLEILGEACARLVKLDFGWPIELSNLKLAIGLRNRIIHGYDAVDDEIVYQTVKDDLPLLKAELSDLLSRRSAS